jgi:hypothetical protein
VGRPKAGRVRGERLVPENQASVGGDPKLELRVGDDDPSGGGMLGGEAVQVERHALDLFESCRAHEFGCVCAGDILVVTLLSLRRRREDRLRQALRLT